MSGGICESPPTMRAVLAWREELIEGRILLRDIIDLDATYGGGPSEDAMNQAVEEIAEMEDEPETKEEEKGKGKGKGAKGKAAKAEEEAETKAKGKKAANSEDDDSEEKDG